MRALKVDEENLINQRDVVKEEVRVNVLNQPYGGFPWLDMPPVAFRNWANAHNFYGDFADLDAASLADVQKFFRTYYVPNNAVLLLLGDVNPKEGLALAEKYFGPISAGAAPPFADPAEPPQTEERRGHVEEKFGTLPAMAIGYVLPQRRTPDWHAMVLLDQALHGGRAGRIHRELVLEKQIAVEADGGDGRRVRLQRPIADDHADLQKPEYSAEQTLSAFDAVLREVQEKGIYTGRIGAVEGEMAVGLLLDARRRTRRVHAALRADASAGVLHALRQRAATGEHDSGRIRWR